MQRKFSIGSVFLLVPYDFFSFRCCGKADEVESQPVSCFIKLYYEPKVVKPR